MKKQNKQLISKIFIVLFILAAINQSSYGLIIANRGDCVLGCDEEKSTGLKSYIIYGAGYLLRSYSDMMLFLDKVEMSELNGIDYTEMRNVLNKAIEKMEMANQYYFQLKQAADNTPYHQSAIESLVSFDYTGFQKERGLNAVIFQDVQAYLCKGDVRGIFSRLLSETEDILAKLYKIKEFVDSDKFPELSILWRVKQSFSELILFGQAAAEIFAETCRGNK